MGRGYACETRIALSVSISKLLKLLKSNAYEKKKKITIRKRFTE